MWREWTRQWHIWRWLGKSVAGREGLSHGVATRKGRERDASDSRLRGLAFARDASHPRRSRSQRPRGDGPRSAWTSGCRGSKLPYWIQRSEEHTSELQSRGHLVCRLLLEKKKDMSLYISSTYI